VNLLPAKQRKPLMKHIIAIHTIKFPEQLEASCMRELSLL